MNNAGREDKISDKTEKNSNSKKNSRSISLYHANTHCKIDDSAPPSPMPTWMKEETLDSKKLSTHTQQFSFFLMRMDAG